MTVNKGLMSSNSQEWATPQNLFKAFDEEFNFVLDVAATFANMKCDHFFDEARDGLAQDWAEYINKRKDIRGGAVWMNPPYNDVKSWVEKAASEAIKGVTVACLLPYRPDTRAWFTHIWDAVTIADFSVAHKPKKGVTVIAIKGRLKFNDSKNSAPFPSVVVVFDGKKYKG